jgi:drug/metabolite transporter (DMT)-like permease
MSPVFTFLAAAALLNERPHRVQIVGVAVAFAGLFVCVRFGGGKELGITYLLNALVLLLSPFFASLHTTLSRPFSQKYGALNTTALTVILGTLPLLFGISPGLIHKIPTLSPGFWAADLFLALGCTATAYLLWTFALGHLEATKVAVFIYFIPVLGVLWGWLYLDEAITSWLLLGAALIVSGVVMTNRQRTRQSSDATK